MQVTRPALVYEILQEKKKIILKDCSNFFDSCFLQGGKKFMITEECPGLKKMEHLKRSLEEAEIIKTGMKLVLMNPSLNSESKGEYEKAFSKLNDDIRALKIMMDHERKITHPSNTGEYET